MNKIAELRAHRAKLIDAFDALVAKMTATDYEEAKEDTEAYDMIKADISATDSKIEMQLESDKLKASIATDVAIAQPDAESITKIPARPARTAAIKNFRGVNAEERAHRFGRFMLASIWGFQKSIDWCRENGIALERAAGESVNSAGGYLVPDEFSLDIIDLRDEYGMFRRLGKNFPMGRDSITVPRRTGGLTAYAVGENPASGSGITESQMTWDQVRLTAKKWGILTVLSSELDEDAAVNIGDILVDEMAAAFAQSEDEAGFLGDGTSTYHGIMGLRTIFNDGVGSLSGAVDAGSGLDTMAEITAADLAAVQGALPQYVYMRGNPTWYCSQTMWANVFERLIGASGGVTKDQASGRTIREYNGYPVEISPALLAPATAATDTSDVAMILFGDISMSSSFGDRRGMTVARSTEYRFAEDQIAIKATERFDLNNHDTGSTSAAGPVVALMGE